MGMTMAGVSEAILDRSRTFERLAKAPIVEAVIDFRARGVSPWEEREISSRLAEAIPEYPAQKRISSFSLAAQFDLSQGPEPAASASQQHGWLGVRVASSDGKHVAMFTRNGFSLSRLAPYESWGQFRAEADRLWILHREMAGVAEVQRIGVRFINRLNLPADAPLEDYLAGAGEAPGGLQTQGFLYQNTLAVPGHPYNVTLVRTGQAAGDRLPDGTTLLLDIDAYCARAASTQPDVIADHLENLHLLKNHVFFSALTEKALQLCR